MDMDLDDNDIEDDGAEVYRCDYSGCDKSFRGDEEWKRHIWTHIPDKSIPRPKSPLAPEDSSNVARPCLTTHYGQIEGHRTPNASPSSTRSSSATNVSFRRIYPKPDEGTGPFAGPSSFGGPPGTFAAHAPYPTNGTGEDTLDMVGQGQRDGRNSRRHGERRTSHGRHHPYPQSSIRNGYDTLNDGDQNETYVDCDVNRNRRYDRRLHSSAAVNVYVNGDQGSSLSAKRVSTSPSRHHLVSHSSQDAPPNDMLLPPVERFQSQSLSRSSSLKSRDSRSPSTSRVTPRSSQDTLYDSTPLPSFGSEPSPRPKVRKGKERARTRSRRYEILLYECGLGFPPWKPSPPQTPGGEYILDIGDVGVFTHGRPFNTLFNIAEPRNHPANMDGIPEGVDPPCALEERSITVVPEYHPPRMTFFQPEGAITEQVLPANDEPKRVLLLLLLSLKPYADT
ncbi:hypothetical protein PQX77_016043 [Marasmius sp. AFHP31]|nr:hypothetical protein PQX77_016043 [Marasmius sp. AFHP31]